ncbi:MAG: methyltransferase [Chloroflexota bacterium]
MISYLKIIPFILVTIVIFYVSRKSLRSPNSHGFYRFFAWEAMLILTLLNIGYWFRDPFAIHQIISWLLLFISVFLALYGVYFLYTIGKPDKNRIVDTPMMGFEKTTTLVTVGAFRYIRHPLYSSLFILNWGIFFKYPSITGGCLALVASLFLVATAKADEGENIRFFGPAYQEYMKKSKMFIPFIF